ncbi:MAG: helix-turn-helix domain-containing protein [Longimicrobiales bacterium]
MRIRQTTRTPAILKELGQRVERLRLQRNQPLASLAEAAGVGTATLQRFESGKSVNLNTLIQVLRALNRLGDLDNIVPDVEVSPFELSGSRSKPRQRASGSSG